VTLASRSLCTPRPQCGLRGPGSSPGAHTLTHAHEQESKSSYQREQQLNREREAQFLDNLKRAILLDGGYVQRLGPQVSDERRCACSCPSRVRGGCRALFLVHTATAVSVLRA
jgi:hypothetical protein